MCKGPELGGSITYRGHTEGRSVWETLSDRRDGRGEEDVWSAAPSEHQEAGKHFSSGRKLGQNALSLASWYPLLTLSSPGLCVGAASSCSVSSSPRRPPPEYQDSRLPYSTCSPSSPHWNQPLHLVPHGHQWPHHSLGPAGTEVEGQRHHPLLQVQQSLHLQSL